MNDSDATETLRREIARILQQQAASSGHRETRPSAAARAVACSSIALLALGPVSSFAVGLGELRLNSRLGQPLRATVALRLGVGETPNPNCIRSTGAPGSALRAPADVSLRVPAAAGPGVFDLELTSGRPLYEPMYELALQIDCPGMPIVVRQYVLMLDLPGTPSAPRASETASPPAMRPAMPPAERPRNRPRARLARSNDPIRPGSLYRVREGDTLSTIASRVQGRPANFTWPLARLIFAANPDAFIRGNPDLVKLGAQLRIPDPSDWSVEPAPAASTLAGLSRTPASPPPAAAETPAPAPAPAANMPAPAGPLPPLAESGPDLSAQQLVPATPAAAGDSPFADDYRSTAAAALQTPPAEPETSVADSAAPAPAARASRSAAVVETTAPPPLVMNPERSSAKLNPLLATLFGMLIGLGMSVLMLRGRLLEGVLSLLERRRPAQQAAAGPAADRTFDTTDDWMPANDTQVDRVPVRKADETYVVEIEGADETSETFNPVLGDAPAEAEPAVANAQALHAGEDSAEPVGDVALTELFDDDLAGLPSEPDLPAEVFMSAGETDDSARELGPTAELPHFHDAATGDTDDTAELAELEDESLNTAGMTLEQLAERGLSSEDTRLSQTLRDALSLLERDYEDELTASQIIDRDALQNALDQKEGSG